LTWSLWQPAAGLNIELHFNTNMETVTFSEPIRLSGAQALRVNSGEGPKLLPFSFVSESQLAVSRHASFV